MVSKIYFGNKNQKKNPKTGKASTLGSGGANVAGWEQQCTPKYGQICVLHGDPQEETCGPLLEIGQDCYDVWVDDPIDPVDPCYDENQMYICDPENPDPIDPDPGNPDPQNGAEFTQADLDSALLVDDGKQKIDNIQKWIDCFGDGKAASSYTITIYIDQPIANRNDQFAIVPPTFAAAGQLIKVANTDMDVGHAFVGFEKNNTDGTNVRQTLGFYPNPAAISNISKGVIKDDGAHGFDVSYKMTVTATQFNNALTGVSTAFTATNYDLLNYNCTDAAIAWMNGAGASLTNASRGLFNNTPGDFGQVLRQQSTANKNGGTAPPSKGKCN